jgi:arsenite methyltransferase
VRRFVDPVLGQLRRPHGALAPATARLLNVVNRPINRLAFAALDITGDEEILDVGFGGGVGLTMVLRRLRTGHATGIDISDAMVSDAPHRFPQEIASGRLRVACADVATLPFADASFDKVYSVNTVFFWPDVAAGLSEIRRVLRPGGRLVIAAPAGGFLLARLAGIAPRSGASGLGETQRRAKDAGFEDAYLRVFGGAALLLASR